MHKRFDSALSALSDTIGNILYHIPPAVKRDVCEIRLRLQRPLCLMTWDRCLFVNTDGTVTDTVTPKAFVVKQMDLQESFRILCGFSVYAHQDEIKNGFVTYLCGHRVGICGTAVVENGVVSSIRDITSMNVRIAKESIGIADDLLQMLGDSITKGLLIAGKPGCGKTTMLRDLCRQLSSGALGRPYKVALIDERSEIAGVYGGELQNDVGICCDVLDGYPKKDGILQALRCLSPQMILCDELGTPEEVEALAAGVHTGVSFLTTLHAGSIEELLQRPQGKSLLQTGAFRHIAFLDSEPYFGHLGGVYRSDALFN